VAYQLDTDACIEHLRGRNQLLSQRIAARPASELRLCSVTVAELYYGLYRGGRVQAERPKLEAFLSLFSSLPFDDRAADIYGRIRTDLTARGQMIGLNDLLIAAIALAHQLTLVTHNTRDFGRIPGLQCEDWQIP
jgi:tRNA(fMet)-specific endonuclease VapC